MKEIINMTRAKMDKAIEHLHTDLKNIRTGRANPSILDSVMIEVYGTKMRVIDVASIATPEQRQILITPFDSNNTNAIAKGVEQANLGFQVVADGNGVRMTIPPMDESVRKEMVKQCNKRAEEGKISIRNSRREANELLKALKKDSSITEDEEKAGEKDVQDMTDKHCKKMDEIVKNKENEVLEI